MVGGGPGAFIGAVHRIAAARRSFRTGCRRVVLQCERARAAALDLHIPAERAYGSFSEMAEAEARRPDRIDAVSIVTTQSSSFAPAKAFLEAGIHVICDKPLTTTGKMRWRLLKLFAAAAHLWIERTITPVIRWCGKRER